MRGRVSVPVKENSSGRWGDLTVFGHSHDICAESVKMIEAKFSFSGNHRVRLYKFSKSVHFRIVKGMELDISSVLPAQAAAPRRQQRQLR